MSEKNGDFPKVFSNLLLIAAVCILVMLAANRIRTGAFTWGILPFGLPVALVIGAIYFRRMNTRDSRHA